jgi:hypothetical protein
VAERGALVAPALLLSLPPAYLAGGAASPCRHGRRAGAAHPLRALPGDAHDTLPEYGPAERGIAALEWLMMAGAWAFALAVVGALCMALGYEW